MIIALCLLLYFLSVVAFAYLASRAVGDSWPAVMAIAWPVILPILLIVVPILWAGEKGEEHS